jgi:hypothetical protein
MEERATSQAREERMAQKTLERPRVLEGTWEEVTRHSGDLAGQRVKVLVYTEGTDETEETIKENGNEPQNLLEFLGDYVGAAHSGGAERLSEDTGERFTDHLVEKRRQGHL